MKARTFRTAEELKGYVLRTFDTVILGGYAYTVCDAHLSRSIFPNDSIFGKLGVMERKTDIARAFYDLEDYDGRTYLTGLWPTYDIEEHALGVTRLVLWCMKYESMLNRREETPVEERVCSRCVFRDFGHKTTPCKVCHVGSDFIPHLGALNYDPEDYEDVDYVPCPAPTKPKMPRTICCPADLEDYTLQPGDTVYISGVKYEVPDGMHLYRVSPDAGRNGRLFGELGINGWKLMQDVFGVSWYCVGITTDSPKDACTRGWPDARDLDMLTKFVKLVYHLVDIKNAATNAGYELGRDEARDLHNQQVEHAIKVLSAAVI